MIMKRLERRLWEKSMVALIDANVVLNYITDREDPFRIASNRTMDLCSGSDVDGYIAFHSVSIIWYSLKIPNEQKRIWLKNICSILTVVGASYDQVLDAIERDDFKDFEDCLQDECAVAIHADCIVTCNAKDFGNAKTKIYNPDEFVALF